jgi:hypothetical protein
MQLKAIAYRTRRRNAEEGTVMVVVSAALFSLAAILSFVIVVGYKAVIHTQLQNAADAAALAGAGTLCGTSICSVSAREVATEILGDHSALSSPGEGQTLTDGAQNFNFTVEIGRWYPSRGFESMEGTWQDLNPGVPLDLSANAVRVTATRPQVRPPLLRYLGFSFGVSASSVALAGPANTVPVAPFAIPACALLDTDGVFRADKICGGDRIFTEAARYCPPGNANCGVIPSFVYDPMPSVEQPPDWWGVDPETATDLRYDLACYWPNPHFQNVADHFGVIGLPQDSAPSEGQIRSILASSSPYVDAALGQSFKILPLGLRESETQTVLWQQIVNQFFDSTKDSHPGWNSPSTKLGAGVNVNAHANWQYFSAPFPPDNRGPGCIGSPTRPDFGTCNSMRFGWGYPELYTANTWTTFLNFSPPNLPVNYLPLSASAFETLPVWKVRIPVIASRQGEACQGILSRTSEAAVDPNLDYEIVGFVPLAVFDADLGHAPPEFPGTGIYDNPFRVSASAMSNHPGAHFGFTIDNAPRNCNVVRTKIICGTDFVASSQTEGPRKANLTE